MGDDCNESSVATSSTPSNWWDINHNQSYNSHWLSPNPNSSSPNCDHQHVSTHSALQSSNLPSDNHIWTQLLLNIGNGVELQSNDQDIGANFLDTISSKNMSNPGIFEQTACSDYLKKMDNNNNNNNNNNWDNFQIFNNNNNNALIATNAHMLENDRLMKFSNLVNTWSIALPSPEAHLRHLMDEEHDQLHATTEPTHGGLEPDATMAQAGLEPGGSALFRRQCYDNASTRNVGDYISFNGRLAKPVAGINGSSNPCFKSMNLSADSKKQIHQNSSPTRISGRGSGVSSEGKKKRSEDSSETSIKKSKQDNNSTNSNASNKMQQPKVKIGDRITALQQIVSPFGKTDTASVLTETIGYIKFLQEQVQLLSNPYMKTNSYKDPWQSMERKEVKGDGKIDLRSKGLCLVPISCTPQVYRENTGSDYWTPYRGCYYR